VREQSRLRKSQQTGKKLTDIRSQHTTFEQDNMQFGFMQPVRGIPPLISYSSFVYTIHHSPQGGEQQQQQHGGYRAQYQHGGAPSYGNSYAGNGSSYADMMSYAGDGSQAPPPQQQWHQPRWGQYPPPQQQWNPHQEQWSYGGGQSLGGIPEHISVPTHGGSSSARGGSCRNGGNPAQRPPPRQQQQDNDLSSLAPSVDHNAIMARLQGR